MEEPHTHRDDPPAAGQALGRRRRPILAHLWRWGAHSLTGSVSAGLLVVPVLLGLLVVRLVAGPLSLGPLKDDLVAAMDEALVGYTIGVDDIRLIWGGWDDPLQLRLLGVSVRPDGTTNEIRVPDASLRFDIVAALKGVIAPTRLAFYAAHLGLTLRADGAVDVGLLSDGAVSGAEALAGSDDLIGGLLAALQGAPNGAFTGDKLVRVAFIQGVVDVDDQRYQARWVARDLTLTIVRQAGGLRADMAFVAMLPENRVPVTASARYVSGDHITTDLDVRGLNPAALARLSPTFAQLAPLDMALSGSLRLVLDARVRLQQGSLRMSGHDGLLIMPDRFPQPLLVRTLVLSALTDNPERQFELDVLAADLDGPAVVVRGGAKRDDAGVWTADLVGDARGVPVGALSLYWPIGLAPPARGWVTQNLEDGVASDAQLEATLEIGPNGTLSTKALTGYIDFDGVTTHYLRPLPPVRGTYGKATFGPDRFDIDLKGGTQDKLRLQRSRVEITQLDTDSERIAIDLVVDGPLRQALELLDRKPLNLIAGLGLKPADVSGQGSAQVHLAFPLVHALKVADVGVSAKADLRDVALTNVVEGVAIDGGTLSLVLDDTAMQVDGQVSIAGAPAEVRWNEVFNAKANPNRRFWAATVLSPEAQRALGWDFAPWVQGRLPVIANYSRAPNGAARVDVDVDLGAAALAVDALKWSKPAGAAGRAVAQLDFMGTQLRAISGLSLVAGPDTVNGAVSFTPEGRFASAQLTDLRLGETDLASVAVHQAGPQRYDVALTGARVDARAYIKDDAPAVPPESVEPVRRGPALAVELNVGGLRLSDKVAFTGATGRLQYDGARVAEADLGLRTPEGSALSLSISPAADGRRLHLVTDDAGALLRTLGATRNIQGGQLTLDGRFDDTQRAAPLAGKLRIDDFRLIQAPLLARLLKAATFGGLDDLLQGEGLSFTRLESGISLAGPILRLDGLRASGGSLGMTAAGVIDMKDDTIDVAGNLVPMLMVNRVLEGAVGWIPLLGDVLTGRNDGGAFAVSYAVKGPLSSAEVRVNPLSALAPGILRELLFDTTPP
jgi:hypothetical protein